MEQKSRKTVKLAIVGRPNVGKSALFNRVCNKRIAIVDEAEGITRDRIYAETDVFGTPIQVIDTGGIDPRSKAEFNDQIKQQAEIAIEEADTLVMVVDSKVGITDLDLEVARVLHRTKKPVCLAVNKVDNPENEGIIHEFYRLGISPIIPVSASQSWQIAELLEAALTPLNLDELEEEEDTGIRISIIGRPNVGKSSLTNYLLDDNRCIVSPIPGTTRDSIDVTVFHKDKRYTFIDTAGIRRKKSEHEVVDKFAAIRTERAIERSDICLLMVDAQQGITSQEKRIAKDIEEAGKGCIVLFNKWDLVKGFRMEHCLKEIHDDFHFLRYSPKLMLSAKTGRNIEDIFPLIQETHESSLKKVPTPELNKFIENAIQRNHPPMIRGKRLRIYYMTQVNVQPPRFMMFINHKDLIADCFERYLYNQFREEFGFTGVPIEFQIRAKKRTSLADGERVSK